jgi:DNA processing protein
VLGSVEALSDCSPITLQKLGLNREAFANIRQANAGVIHRWRHWLGGSNRSLIPLESPAYPSQLAELPDAPLALWVEGARPDLLTGPQLSIVGSRRPSVGGLETARRFAAELAAAGITVTSGLALGIDAAAHHGAVDSIGGTLAVLGSGVDQIYPRRNQPLASRIVEHGLIVSEYPPGEPTRPHHFPQRNRIIAGLGLGTLVIEAARRSGSLITARLAGDYGRHVFAVPGSIHSDLSKGCHALLRSGAGLVESVDDILLEIAPQLARTLSVEMAESTVRQASFARPISERNLLEMLDFSPVTIAELASRTALTTAELSSMLLHLELEGTVEALPGGRYSRLLKRGR